MPKAVDFAFVFFKHISIFYYIFLGLSFLSSAQGKGNVIKKKMESEDDKVLRRPPGTRATFWFSFLLFGKSWNKEKVSAGAAVRLVGERISFTFALSSPAHQPWASRRQPPGRISLGLDVFYFFFPFGRPKTDASAAYLRALGSASLSTSRLFSSFRT